MRHVLGDLSNVVDHDDGGCMVVEAASEPAIEQIECRGNTWTTPGRPRKQQQPNNTQPTRT